MNNSSEFSEIFTRYDIAVEKSRHQHTAVSSSIMLRQIAECLVSGSEDEIEELVARLLEESRPEDIISEGLIPGMREVSRLWDSGVYFLPQVILSSDAMLAGIALCEKKMSAPLQKKAPIVTHTAEGDIHDIGQAIVNALLNASGFEVINLGADVPVERVVEACRMHKPAMVTGTALMTTTMTAFPRIASRLIQSGITIPFVCGGGAVCEEFVNSFDLGIWGREAAMAPAMADDAQKGLSWQEMRARWNG